MASIFMTNIWLDFIVAFKRNHIRLVVFFSLFACVRRKVSKIRYWKWFVESLGQWFCSSLSHSRIEIDLFCIFTTEIHFIFFIQEKKGMNDKMVHGLESNYTENSNLYLSLWREHSLFRRVFTFCFHRLALFCLSRNHLQKPIRNGWRWFPFIACSAANSLGNWSLWNIARDNTIRLGITFANSNKVAKITCTFFVWFNLLFIQSNKWQSERQKIDSHPFWNGTHLDDFFFIYIQLIDG